MYQVVYENGVFRLLKGAEVLRTPAGRDVRTDSEALARKLAEHCEMFGAGGDNPLSIAFFHYPRLDFVEHYPRPAVEQLLILKCDPFHDWTLRPQNGKNGKEKLREYFFGTAAEAQIRLKTWLGRLSVGQLAAVLVLGNYLNSVNAAYLAAHCGDDTEQTKLLRQLVLAAPEMGQRPLKEVLANFRLYWIQ